MNKPNLAAVTRHWDIGARVLAAAVIPAALVALVLAWYFTATRIADSQKELSERGLAIARQLAPAAEFGVFSANEDILRQLAEAAARESGVEGVAILDRNGRILAASGARVTGPQSPPVDARLERAADRALVFSAPVGGLRSAVDPVIEGDAAPTTLLGREQPAIGMVLLQLSTQPFELRRRDLILGATIITLVGLALAATLAQILARGVTGPITRLGQVVARIGRGDFTARASEDAGGRLGALERGVNTMAESLDDARSHLEDRIAQATAEIQAARDRAELANRTKTQFLAAASHDLRQPLQALGLLVNALRNRVKEPTTAAMVVRVEHALAGLEAVLEGLLDISRLDANSIAPNIEPFPLARVLGRVGETFSAHAAAKGLRLRVMPTRAWCASDPLLLERIVSNFVSNALRYTVEGGVVVGCRRRGDSLAIEVWDSGSGIPNEKLGEIFREFVQLANPSRQRDQGLGLGLAIVDRLGRLLGHPIGVRSRPGRGSVFTVGVPRAEPAQVAAIDTASPLEDTLEGLTILVIDDDIEVLEAMETFLRGEGAQVFGVTSLPEAKRRLRAMPARPNVVITDYELGTAGDGIEALAALESEFGALPAIIITGDTDPRILQPIQASGLPLASKPVRPDLLKAMIRRVAHQGTGSRRQRADD